MLSAINLLHRLVNFSNWAGLKSAHSKNRSDLLETGQEKMFNLQLTLPKVHTVHTVQSAVALKWPVEFKNGMIMTPIFTIMFISKMLIKQISHN